MIFDFNPHTGIHVLMQEHGGYYKHPQRSACWSIVLKDLKDTLTFCCHQETIRLHNRWKYLIIMYWIPCNYPWNSVFCGVCVCVWVVFFFYDCSRKSLPCNYILIQFLSILVTQRLLRRDLLLCLLCYTGNIVKWTFYEHSTRNPLKYACLSHYISAVMSKFWVLSSW